MGKFYIESSIGNSPPEKIVVEKIVEVIVEKPIEVIVEKIVTNEVIVEKIVTNEVIVEKLVYLPVKVIEQVEKLKIVYKEIPIIKEVSVIDMVPYLEERARADKFEKQSKQLKLALAITIILVSFIGVLV